MKTFKIKVLYSNGFSITEITGKNFIDAFSRYYKAEEKSFRYITGYTEIKD